MADLMTALAACLTLSESLSEQLSLQFSPSSISTIAPNTTPSIVTIRSDILVLSAELSKSCTNLSLALKPTISLPAALGVAETLQNVMHKLSFCVNLLGEVERSVLGKEIK